MTYTLKRHIERLVQANCNIDEIAAYYRVTQDTAYFWMVSARKSMKRQLRALCQQPEYQEPVKAVRGFGR